MWVRTEGDQRQRVAFSTVGPATRVVKQFRPGGRRAYRTVGDAYAGAAGKAPSGVTYPGPWL